MRNLFYLVLLLGLCLPAIGQQYQYVPTTANPALWQVIGTREKPDSPNFRKSCTQVNYQFYMDGSDTVFGGFTWKKVIQRSYQKTTTIPLNDVCQLPNVMPKVANTKDYIFFLKEDDKEVSIYDRGLPIYDFKKSVGDGSFFMGTILAIDTIEVAGVLRRRFLTNSVHIGPDTIVEGVGSIRCGINPIVFGKLARVTCYQLNGNFVPLRPYSDCGAIFPNSTPTKVPGVVEPADISVYPNPFTESIQINNAPAGATAVLYNSVGQLITAAGAGVDLIGTAELPVDMYYLILKNNNGEVIHTKKLTKQ